MASKTVKTTTKTTTKKSDTRGSGYTGASKGVKANGKTSTTANGYSSAKKTSSTSSSSNVKKAVTKTASAAKNTKGSSKTVTTKSTTKKTVGSKNSGQTGYSQNQKQVNIPTMPITVHGQYIKDLSFETPGPFATAWGDGKDAPQIDLNIEVRANPVQSKQFEVELHVTANASFKGKKVFVCELAYAGLFSIGDVAEQHIAPILLIECPRMLFPFARAIIADVTREGGYPPLALTPVDFADIYRQQLAQLQSKGAAKQA